MPYNNATQLPINPNNSTQNHYYQTQQQPTPAFNNRTITQPTTKQVPLPLMHHQIVPTIPQQTVYASPQQQQQHHQGWSPIVGGSVSSPLLRQQQQQQLQPQPQLNQQESILRLPRGPDGSMGFHMRR